MPVFINKGTQLDANDVPATVGAPNLTPNQSAVFNQDSSGTYVWTLDASVAGQQIAALPDVAIIGNGKPGESFLQDQVQFFELAVYQRYTATPITAGGDAITGIAKLAGAGVEPDQVLAGQYAGYMSVNSYFIKLIVPALQSDRSDGLYNYDYEDGYVVALVGNDGIIDDSFPMITDPFQGRFLMVIGQVGGQRNAAWGDWLEKLDPNKGGGGGGGGKGPKAVDPILLQEHVNDLRAISDIGDEVSHWKDMLLATTDYSGTAVGTLQNASELFTEFRHKDWLTTAWNATALSKKLKDNKIDKVLTKLGYVVSGIDAAHTAYQTYANTGSKGQAIADGSVKLVGALLSGEIGAIVGLKLGAGAAFYLAGGSALAATGLPILVGLSAAYVTAKGVNFAFKYAEHKLGLYSYAPGDPLFKTVDDAETAGKFEGGVPDTVGKKVKGLEIGNKAPDAQWSYNVKKNKFKFLDKDLAKKFDKIATAMEIHPNPVALTLKGDKFNNVVDDLLIGHAAGDTLEGLLGNDVLSGGEGNDRLNGGANDDALIGDYGDDTLEGGEGNDALDGGPGNDVLTGGPGRDSFVFSVAQGAANADRILDFVSGTDRIELIMDAFGGVPPGILAVLVVGEAASPDDRIILDGDTLYYDPDGNGLAPKLPFAELQPGAGIVASDIEIIGSLIVTS